ncbi:DUF47 family protein [Mucilaginibacter koreensis]
MPDFNQVFFNLFNQSASNTMAMAGLLYKALNTDNAEDRRPMFNHISRLNATASELRQQIYAVSSRSFVSPFERNDMCNLALAIYETSNMIDVSARRINLYVENDITPFAKELAGVISDCCSELEKVIQMLHDLKQAEAIAAGCETIRNYEDYADKLHSKAVNQLLSDQMETLEMIKHTDVLASLEKATDRCEHVTKVLETILIKNS